MVAPCFAIPVEAPGRLCVMPCPTAADFETLTDLGVNTVVSMLPEDEARSLGMADEAALCGARSIAFVSHPIKDFGLPDLQCFGGLIADLTARINAGASVAVHCRAGIGRSGMVAACILVALGNSTAEATAQVSKARGVSIPDTVEQARFVSSFAQSLNGGEMIGI